jgi:hypothetical protein
MSKIIFTQNFIHALWFKLFQDIYIYILYLFFKSCPCATHIYSIYSIGPTPKSIEYHFFGLFLKFSELTSQFSSDMSGLCPGHIRLAGHVQVSGFQPPKVEWLLPHFLVLHQMMRKTLSPRVGYSEVIPAYERNLLDALMKPVRFDIFEYILDEICNIATNPLRSRAFASYIQFMIESVA